MTCRLESVTELTRDTSRYRFATPRPLHSTPMAHVLAVDEGNILRPYTPVAESATGFEIVVRRYPRRLLLGQVSAARGGRGDGF